MLTSLMNSYSVTFRLDWSVLLLQEWYPWRYQSNRPALVMFHQAGAQLRMHVACILTYAAYLQSYAGCWCSAFRRMQGIDTVHSGVDADNDTVIQWH